MSELILKFLADESVEYSLVIYLRNQGYDVWAIADSSPAITDQEVLKKAFDNNRIVLTNDKDFGDLVFLNSLPHKGVILFRLKDERNQSKMGVLHSLLRDYSDKLANSFTVVDEEKVRIRS